jgi:N-acyl-D-aspartate/D-glutamate deacylase
MAEYLERLASGRPGVNVISLVPNGNLRVAVAGLVERPSTMAKVRQMKRLDVNPNTGEAIGRHTHTMMAHNTVYLDRHHPSHPVLPIIPGR